MGEFSPVSSIFFLSVFLLCINFLPINFPSISFPPINLASINFPSVNFPSISFPSINFTSINFPYYKNVLQSTGLWGNSRLYHLINVLTYHLINLPSLLQINSQSFKRMCVPGITLCQKKFGPKIFLRIFRWTWVYGICEYATNGLWLLVSVGPE